MLMSFTWAGSCLLGSNFFILGLASINFLLITLIISHDLVLIIMSIALSDVLREPLSQGFPPAPSPQGSLEASAALCSQALPAQVWVPAGRGREGGRQVSLTTLPPSSLGRSWPSSLTTLQMGGACWPLLVSRPSQGEEGGDPTDHLGRLGTPWDAKTTLALAHTSSLARGLAGSVFCLFSHRFPPSRLPSWS